MISVGRTRNCCNTGPSDSTQSSWKESLPGWAQSTYRWGWKIYFFALTGKLIWIWMQIDPTGDGSIDFNTFCKCMEKNYALPSTEAEVLEVTRILAKFFDRSNLTNLCSGVSRLWQEQQWHHVYSRADDRHAKLRRNASGKPTRPHLFSIQTCELQSRCAGRRGGRDAQGGILMRGKARPCRLSPARQGPPQVAWRFGELCRHGRP